MDRPNLSNPDVIIYVAELEKTIVDQTIRIKELKEMLEYFGELLGEETESKEDQLKCAKCAGDEVSKKWHPKELTLSGQKPQRIEYTCDDCGFFWEQEI